MYVTLLKNSKLGRANNHSKRRLVFKKKHLFFSKICLQPSWWHKPTFLQLICVTNSCHHIWLMCTCAAHNLHCCGLLAPKSDSSTTCLTASSQLYISSLNMAGKHELFKRHVRTITNQQREFITFPMAIGACGTIIVFGWQTSDWMRMPSFRNSF